MQRLVLARCMCGKKLRWGKDGTASCSKCDSGYSAEFGLSLDTINKELLLNNVRVIEVEDSSKYEESCVSDRTQISEEDIRNIAEELASCSNARERIQVSRLVRKKCVCGQTLFWYTLGHGVCTSKKCGRMYYVKDQMTVEHLDLLSEMNGLRVISVELKEVMQENPINIIE